jgi:hypothetical protein
MIYLGYDVLALNYDRIGPIKETSHRKFVLLDSGLGKRTPDQHAPAPAPVRPFTWTAFGREEIATMRAFIDARAGRAVPFWLPSYQWDLSLAEDLELAESVVTINWVRYRGLMFGTTGARRHVALWNLGIGTFDCYRIADATDPGNFVSETLTLDPGAVRAYAQDQTVISFLKLCRLESDHVETSYPANMIAQATIQVRELPMEAPL